MAVNERSVTDSSTTLCESAALLHAVSIYDGIFSLSLSIGALPFSSWLPAYCYLCSSFLQFTHEERVMIIKIDKKALSSTDVQKHAT